MAAKDTDDPRGRAGLGVDWAGNSVMDPTANVIANLEAAVKRLDDLRVADNKRLDDLRSMRELYEGLLREAAGKLSEAESARIDAIRAVDVGAVNRAAEVAAQQQTVLAAQVATSAEALRNQAQAAATVQAANLAAALEPMKNDIADLRRAQYEAQGQRAQVVETRGVSTAVLGWVVGALSFLGLAVTIAVMFANRGA